MLTISNVSVRAFNIAVRWARMNKFPNNIKDWTAEQNNCLQFVAEVIDRKHKKRK